MENPILIIGGGIGGLTAAIALRQKGFDVEVHEKRSGFPPLGIGLGVAPNGVMGLRHLGLETKVIHEASQFKHYRIQRSDGHPLWEQNLDQWRSRVGAASLGMLRARLHKILIEACEGIPIHYEHGLADYNVRGNQVIARFDNGDEAVGSILIGADGVRSTVRRVMLNDGPPRPVCTWWGAVGEANDLMETGAFNMTMGEGRMAVTFAVDEKNTCIAVSGEQDNEARNFETAVTGGRKDGRMVDKETLLKWFGHWSTPIGPIVERIPAESYIRWDAFDRPRTKHLAIGRVALLGDAVHSLAPTLGQGANQTIEDSVFLADSLSHISDPVQALGDYARKRKDRTRRAVAGAYWLTQMGSIRNPLVCGMRDITLKFAPGLITKLFETTYIFPDLPLNSAAVRR